MGAESTSRFPEAKSTWIVAPPIRKFCEETIFSLVPATWERDSGSLVCDPKLIGLKMSIDAAIRHFKIDLAFPISPIPQQTLTLKQRRSESLQVALEILTLLQVAAEWIAHSMPTESLDHLLR